MIGISIGTTNKLSVRLHFTSAFLCLLQGVMMVPSSSVMERPSSEFKWIAVLGQ